MPYSPFVSANGSPLTLCEIEYSHLSQLLEIEEGYKVEYKSLWDNSLKRKHLAKTISSFANTEGGWLFVGIEDDGNISPIEKGRTDFSQQISMIVKTKISPFPAFETRFIDCPHDAKKGVLVIHVREGVESPYICDGTIYIRIGSSKTPVKSSNRAEIDNLINKGEAFRRLVDGFCVDNVINNESFPYCVIYLYSKYPSKHLDVASPNARDRIEPIAEKYRSKAWMPSTQSILFYNAEAVSESSYTTIIEQFFNYNMKFYIPLTPLPNSLSVEVASIIKQKNPKTNIDGFTAIDGFLSYKIIAHTFDVALEMLSDNNITLEDYIIKWELKNVRNSYLYFATKNNEWLNFISEKNFRYSTKHDASGRLFALEASNYTVQLTACK